MKRAIAFFAFSAALCAAAVAGAAGGQAPSNAQGGAGEPGQRQRPPRPSHHDPAAGFVSRTLQEGLFLRFADFTAGGVDLNGLTGRMAQSFEIAIDCVREARGEGEGAFAAASRVKAAASVGAVVAVVEDGAGSPTLAVYPEDCVAILNIDRLREGLGDGGDELLGKRLGKELWRAAAFALGGYESDYACALKAVFSMADLDANPMEMTCPPVSGHVSRSGKRLGFGRVQTVPYFIALRQGWAPEPANDAQRAEKERYEAAKARKAEREANAEAKGAK